MREEHRYTHTHIHTTTRNGIHVRKRYGLMAFMFDVLMCLITGGLWLIWIFVREMRGSR
jgi:hypothetical protein